MDVSYSRCIPVHVRVERHNFIFLA
jgi:hypothetical protein